MTGNFIKLTSSRYLLRNNLNTSEDILMFYSDGNVENKNPLI